MAKFQLTPVQKFQSTQAREHLVKVREAFGGKKRRNEHAIAILHLETAIHNIDEFLAIADKRPAQEPANLTELFKSEDNPNP